MIYVFFATMCCLLRRTVTCERCLFGFPTLGVPKDLEKRSVLMQESIIVMPDVIHDPTLPRVSALFRKFSQIR